MCTNPVPCQTRPVHAHVRYLPVSVLLWKGVAVKPSKGLGAVGRKGPPSPFIPPRLASYCPPKPEGCAAPALPSAPCSNAFAKVRGNNGWMNFPSPLPPPSCYSCCFKLPYICRLCCNGPALCSLRQGKGLVGLKNRPQAFMLPLLASNYFQPDGCSQLPCLSCSVKVLTFFGRLQLHIVSVHHSVLSTWLNLCSSK